jgi:hypothetical protein
MCCSLSYQLLYNLKKILYLPTKTPRKTVAYLLTVLHQPCLHAEARSNCGLITPSHGTRFDHEAIPHRTQRYSVHGQYVELGSVSGTRCNEQAIDSNGFQYKWFFKI